MKHARLVKNSSVLSLYPTITREIGTMGKALKGGLPPSTSLTNSSHVFQTIKTFGQRSRDNVYVLSRPVLPKKRG